MLLLVRSFFFSEVDWPIVTKLCLCSMATQIYKIRLEIWVASSPQNLVAERYQNFRAFLDNFAT